jgi:glycosidase
MPGAPQIYYGDEAGMWGGDDPDCRKPMVWPDDTYEDETVHPFGIKRILDKVKFNDELFNWIKNLARIRNDNRALSLGTIDFDIIDNDASVLSYRRKLENDEVLVVVNRNPVEVEINSISVKFLESKADWKDLITGVKISKGNSIVKLDPYQILILK